RSRAPGCWTGLLQILLAGNDSGMNGSWTKHSLDELLPVAPGPGIPVVDAAVTASRRCADARGKCRRVHPPTRLAWTEGAAENQRQRTFRRRGLQIVLTAHRRALDSRIRGNEVSRSL